MATRDESHLFSLAALTTRSPAPVPELPPSDPEPPNLERPRAPEPAPAALGGGWPLFPLGAPLGSPTGPLEPAPQARAGLTRTLALVVLGLLLGAGIVATAVVAADATGEATATLAPETSTPTPALPPLEAPSPPELPPPAVQAAPSMPESQASAAVAAETPRLRVSDARGGVRPRPRPNPSREAQATPPEPKRPAARGRCAHCAPQDLACNIKCSAGG